MAATQQCYHQAADNGVLADDHLGDFGPKASNAFRAAIPAMSPPLRLRPPGRWGCGLLAESRLCDLPFDVVERVGKVYQVGVGHRRRTEQLMPYGFRISLRCASLGTAAGSALGPRPSRGRGPSCRVAVRSASAARSLAPARPVEPPAPLGGFRGTHHRPGVARRPADRFVGPSTARATERSGTAARRSMSRGRGSR